MCLMGTFSSSPFIKYKLYSVLHIIVISGISYIFLPSSNSKLHYSINFQYNCYFSDHVWYVWQVTNKYYNVFISFFKKFEFILCEDNTFISFYLILNESKDYLK